MIKFLDYKNEPIKIFLLLISVFFAIIPLYDFLVNGPFSWHIRQPAAAQGAIELLVVFMFSYFSLRFFGRAKLVFSVGLVALTALYLRRHNVDVIFLINLVYVSSLYFLGSIVLSKINISYRHSMAFLLGICLWISYLFLLSFYSLATINILVVSSGIVFIISIFFKKHNIIYYAYSFLKEQYKTKDISYPFLISLFYILFLVLLVQTSQKPSYDEFWYSLRGTEVLNQNGSFLEPILMLQHWVSFYPKLYEITIYPLEYFDSFTSERMFTVFVLMFFSLAIYETLKVRLNTLNTLYVIFIILSTPAVANSSIIAKADLISAFIVFMSVVLFLKYTENKLFSYFIFSLLLILFSLTTKLSVLPYIAILGFLFILYFLKNIKSTNYTISRFHYITYALLLIVFFLVTYRTINIVGVPFISLRETSSFIKMIYEQLGFTYNGIFADINVVKQQNFYSIYELFIKYNFYPTETRMIFAWISNIYTIIFGLFFMYIFKNKVKIDITQVVIVILIIVFLFVLYVLFGKKVAVGGDGNYHLFPIIALITLISLEQKIVKYYKFFIPILAVNIVVLFITNHGWSFGTNKFDLNFSKNPFDKESKREESLKNVGAEDIYKYLKQINEYKKVIGYGPEENLYMLNAIYESGQHLTGQRPYLFKDFETFKNMLLETKTTHLLYPKYIPNNKFVEYSEAVGKCKNSSIFTGKAYVLVSIDKDIKNCNYTTVSNKFAKEELYIFKEPNKVIYDKFNTNLWIKPFLVIKDKYFRENSIAIRNSVKIIYENIEIAKASDNLKFSFKAMKYYLHKSINYDFGFLNVIIKDSNGKSIEQQIKIREEGVEDIKIDLKKLNGERYTIEIENKGWKSDVQVVLINPKIIIEND